VEVPSAIQRLLRRCLAKDRRERMQAIGDVRIEIEECLSTPTGAEAARLKPMVTGWRREQLAWGVAGLLAVCLLATLLFFLRYLGPTLEREKDQVIRFQFPSPEKTTLDYYSAPRVSFDGRRVAFTALSNGESLLYVRSFDSLTTEALPGTEGARDPFWSPDSQSIGFTDPILGKLKKIRLSDRVTRTLCDATAWFGGSWNREGVILFTKHLENSPIYRVPDKGGEPKPVTPFDSSRGQILHEFPVFFARRPPLPILLQERPKKGPGHLPGFARLQPTQTRREHQLQCVL
jgi:eukaryotic-like serine/threonine-protein kinase